MTGHLNRHESFMIIGTIGNVGINGDKSVAAAPLMAARAATVVTAFNHLVVAFQTRLAANDQLGVGVVINAIGVAWRRG